MRTLSIDEFLRSFKQNMDRPHSLLLGAGASIESNVKSAIDCIWDWKRDIVVSRRPTMSSIYSNTKSERVRKNIQAWLDDQGIYPKDNSADEYSFYAEIAYPLADDRNKYFQSLFENAKPSLGYHIISFMSELNVFKSVWTTNFDGLMEKCAHLYNLMPISIATNSIDRFYKTNSKNELFIVPLHGDYKFGKLKNTASELDSQNDEYVKALSFDLTDKDLIVIGYSGRDVSLMTALKSAYSNRGAGRLFWCGYGNKASTQVENLIDYINSHNRTAYYIPCNGFDDTLYAMASVCYGDNNKLFENIKAIKSKLATSITADSNKFLSFSPNSINKIVDTNLYPMSFPNHCYQFEFDATKRNDIWSYCKNITSYHIVAVPYKDMIYAWGEKDTIAKLFKDIAKSDITVAPLTKDSVFSISALKYFVTRSVTTILATNANLQHNSCCIWDQNQPINFKISDKTITAYKGAKLSIIFYSNRTFFSITPDYHYEETITLSKSEKKAFADYFNNSINGKQPNKNIRSYVTSWVDALTRGQHLTLNFPIDAHEKTFEFKFSNVSANGKISNTTKYYFKAPNTFNDKRLIINGTECFDPLLQFYNMQQNKVVCDFHPMRGLTQNAPIDAQTNVSKIKTSIKLGVICPNSYENDFYNFLVKLNSHSDVKFNIEYVIPFPGFNNAFKTSLNIPTISSQEWVNIAADQFTTPITFGDILARKLDQLSALSVDVILIYIPKEYEYFTSENDEDVSFDLHDYIKAYAAQKQIATQFIREKTIDSNLICQVLWAISLAIYVKSNRTPWLVSNTRTDTAFAGIGYSVKKSNNSSNVIIGCSHIYSSDGQGLKYKLSKLHDVVFDKKNNPYLSENEAYKLGITIKELFYDSFSEIPKRVVIHKRTPFRQAEIKGLVESLSGSGIKDIELLEISFEDDIKCFAYNRNISDGDGFPVKRGLCLPISNNTMLLFTHGIAPAINNPNFSYIQGGKSIPMPLKVVSHYGSSSMQEIATEILGLSKMNWNSFGLYTKLPCTIDSSNEIARIGWLLSQYEGALFEYRFFM